MLATRIVQAVLVIGTLTLVAGAIVDALASRRRNRH